VGFLQRYLSRVNVPELPAFNNPSFLERHDDALHSGVVECELDLDLAQFGFAFDSVNFGIAERSSRNFPPILVERKNVTRCRAQIAVGPRNIISYQCFPARFRPFTYRCALLFLRRIRGKSAEGQRRASPSDERNYRTAYPSAPLSPNGDAFWTKSINAVEWHQNTFLLARSAAAHDEKNAKCGSGKHAMRSGLSVLKS